MTTRTDKPVIALDSSFKFGAVDGIQTPLGLEAREGIKARLGLEKVGGSIDVAELFGAADNNAVLGPLARMVGSWTGSGFNTIFRPLNSKSPNTLPVPPTGDNILELNVTSEKMTFTRIDGDIPNRGMIEPDIALAGMTYLQQVSDVTTPPGTGIHIEPGIWIVIPEATTELQDVTVARMASIPHGTTVNAQGSTTRFNGPPTIPTVDITPILLGGNAIKFPSQTATNEGTARIPQDLRAFIASGTITQAMLDDPNAVLRSAIADQKITNTTEINISTDIGGTANIGFLVNGGSADDSPGNPKSPNAQAVKMTATFWIETVSKQITIPPFKPGSPPVHIPLGPALPGHPLPELLVDPGREITAARVITIEFTQIQYTQTVFLNFNGLSWPHVSVATLVSAAPVTVPPTAWS